jgi:hypothetical protein
MRSETETGREGDRDEPGFIKCEQALPVNECPAPSYEELVALEKALFGGTTDSTSEQSEQLEWNYIRSDNYMIRTLKQAVNSASHMLERQLKTVEKDIKQAKKVFYG